MVFRRNRGNRLRPVNRIKHVVDLQAGIVANTQLVTVIVQATDTPVLANTGECETGSSVNGIYARVEAYATTAGALSNIYLAFAKNPGNNLVLPNANVIGSSDNKKYIFHQEMVMLQQEVNGNPRTLFDGVIPIPRGYRRNGPNDSISILLLAPGVNVNICIQAHYKEFR